MIPYLEQFLFCWCDIPDKSWATDTHDTTTSSYQWTEQALKRKLGAYTTAILIHTRARDILNGINLGSEWHVWWPFKQHYYIYEWSQACYNFSSRIGQGLQAAESGVGR